MKTTIRLGETTLERRGRPAWKELLPKEHGVWAWLVLPLVLALCLAPTVSTFAGALSVVSGFGAAQALGRAVRGSRLAAKPTMLALILANIFGFIAVANSPHPGVLVATLLGGGFVGFIGMLYLRGRPPRLAGFELLGIAGFLGLAIGLALAGGALPGRVVAGAMALGAWLVLGLWWIKGSLAKVLSNRQPWPAGRWFSAVAVAASLALGVAVGHPAAGALPLLYGLRVALHRAPNHARDAKRLGLIELAWGTATALAAGLVSLL